MKVALAEERTKGSCMFVSRTRRSVVQAVCLSLDNYQIKDGYWINRTPSILLCGIYQKIFLQTDTHSLPNHWIDGIQMSMKMYTYNCENWINPIQFIWFESVPFHVGIWQILSSCTKQCSQCSLLKEPESMKHYVPCVHRILETKFKSCYGNSEN